MSILFIIMLAPLALMLGFLLIRLLMEPTTWVILFVVFCFFMLAILR